MTTTVLTQDQERKNLFAKLDRSRKAVGTVQEGVHDVLIDTIIFAWKYKGEGCDVVSKVINAYDKDESALRIAGIGYWLNEVAGFAVTFDKSYKISFAPKGIPSSIGIDFTYDAKHLAKCKEEAYRFWRIMPQEAKILKMPGDAEKATQSAEIMLARALAGGALGEAEIQAHLANMLDRVKQIAANGKTKEWLEKYYLQNPSEKPSAVESKVDDLVCDAEEQEIAELLELDRIAALGNVA